jgi:hypothetical protein
LANTSRSWASPPTSPNPDRPRSPAGASPPQVAGGPSRSASKPNWSLHLKHGEQRCSALRSAACSSTVQASVFSYTLVSDAGGRTALPLQLASCSPAWPARQGLLGRPPLRGNRQWC